MARDLKLRSIRTAALPAALEKANHYRLLNEPEQAESICLDVLLIEPAHPEALKLLILSLTDQFQSRAGALKRARARVSQLQSDYDRFYFAGLICEREARAHLARGVGAGFAHDLFMEALEFYERAEKLRPADNDDAILRRNSCLRALSAQGLEPLVETGELPLE